MSALLTASQLVELAHQYLPRGLGSSAPEYFESEEYGRLEEVREAAQAHSSPFWNHLLEQIEAALPQCRVQDWSVLLSDNCLRARMELPGSAEHGREQRAVVLLVSILAPVYCLYSSFRVAVGGSLRPARTTAEDVPETKGYVDAVDSVVRREWGFQRLSNETLLTPLPDLSFRHARLGEARLIDCLFTDDRW
jgi:hypothetical protein